MNKDIETRQDLEFLLTEFYKKATTDARIGHHFDCLDLVSHLPVIVNFWEKILLGNPVYFGNPLAVHQKINEKAPLDLEDFRRWTAIFSQTVDEYFTGKTAENAKLRAKMIAHSLHQRISEDNRNKK